MARVSDGVQAVTRDCHLEILDATNSGRHQTGKGVRLFLLSARDLGNEFRHRDRLAKAPIPWHEVAVSHRGASIRTVLNARGA